MNANLFQYLTPGDTPPDKVLLASPQGFTLRYGELGPLTASIARALTASGARPGDRVLAQIPKSPQAMAAYLAALRAGLVYVPLNNAYRSAELDFFIGDSEPALILCDPADQDEIAALGNAANRPILTLDETGTGSLADAAATERKGPGTEFQTFNSAPDDLACILYTSGTTGRSKGAMITHKNLSSNTDMLLRAWAISKNDHLIHALPIFHVHGLFVALHTALRAGASMTWLDRFDPETVAAALPQATLFMGVPTYYTRLLAQGGVNREAVRNMRLFISGSAPLLAATFQDFQDRTGHAILERYGMTETGMNTSNPLEGERRPGSIGLPLPGVEVRICNDAGETLGVNEPGGLEVRGANVFSGYWRMPERSREDFRAEGYFKTGDVALMGPDGYITLTGRHKDMIITGGLNVYPREVEEVIDSLSGVAESAVFGAPHPDFGEGVLAAIVTQNGAALDTGHLIDEVRDHLAGFKCPKQVFLVDALPRNTMGKVQKAQLRERYAKTFQE